MTTQTSTTLQSPIPLQGFDSIKADLLSYLQSQPQFSGYNFAGSNFQVLINLLAYNTYQNILYNNLSVNEMFLDSASKRDSIVSRANELGYLPISTTSARATINMHVNPGVPGSPSTITLPAFSQFTASINGVTYNFYTLQAYVAPVNSDGSYDFQSVVLVEGKPLSNSYNFTGNSSTQLPMMVANPGADLGTLGVNVYPSVGSVSYTVYSPVDDLTAIDSTTPIYFVKESRNQLYEVQFGQNGFGLTPPAGAVVQLSYLVSSADAANGASTFNYTAGTFSGATVVLNTISAASGGAPIESIDSIRFNAPRAYAAQNRAVNVDDYKVLVKQLLPSAQAINVWGGEDNIPPQYGQVFICVKPTGATSLSSTESTLLSAQIKQKGMVTATPNLVLPDQLQINIRSTVFYNPLLTSQTPNQLQALVQQTIQNWQQNISQFESLFRYSNLSTAIDETDVSIQSNDTSVTLTRIYNPQYIYYGTPSTYSFVLGNPIEYTGQPEEAVVSSGFTISGDTVNTYYIDDDGVGNLRLFYYDASQNKVISNPKVGTVDYNLGSITIPSLNITSVVGGVFSFDIRPQSYDVFAYQTQLLSIATVTVDVVIDPVATNTVPAGGTYPFANIRS